MDLRRKIAARRMEKRPQTEVATVEGAPGSAPEEGGLADPRVARLRQMLDALSVRQRAKMAETDRGRKRKISRDFEGWPDDDGDEPKNLDDWEDGRSVRALRGRECDSPLGPYWRVDEILPLNHCHGRTQLSLALHVPASTLAGLARDVVSDWMATASRGLLYLDTETTGLSGGTGTLPFLIGMAWMEDEAIRVVQLLAREPGEEKAILAVAHERIEAAGAVVTFNGKSFDVPLLRNRFVMHKMPALSSKPHVDLLHAARRVYRRRLGDVRLVALEAELLGLRREGDIFGGAIGPLYWACVRSKNVSPLGVVAEHNRKDVLALVALLGVMASCYEAPERAGDPIDHLGYAHLARRAMDFDRAEAFLQAVLHARAGADGPTVLEALRLCARVARDRGDHERERTAREQMLALFGDDATLASIVHRDLAKLFEHRIKDYASALVHAAHTDLAEGGEAHRRRIDRLTRKSQAYARE